MPDKLIASDLQIAKCWSAVKYTDHIKSLLNKNADYETTASQ